MATDTTRDYLRLSLFMQTYFESEIPHFWDDDGVIAPFYPFELRIEPVEDEPWKWEATFWYDEEIVETVKSNSFSDHFANEIQQVLVSLRHRVKGRWKETAQQVLHYLDIEHRLELREVSDPYEKVDKNSPHHDDIMEKYCEVKGDVTNFEYEVILYVFESKDPVLILHSDERLVYALHPDDEEGYKGIIDDFMDTVQMSESNNTDNP